MHSASEPLFLRVAPSLFQKKKGARLVAAIPFVRELYGPHDPDYQNSSDSSRAHEIGSIKAAAAARSREQRVEL